MFVGRFCGCSFFFFYKQTTAYEVRISDWSSDVCSSDLTNVFFTEKQPLTLVIGDATFRLAVDAELAHQLPLHYTVRGAEAVLQIAPVLAIGERSEERRVGQEGVSTGSFRWSPYPSQKNNTN